MKHSELYNKLSADLTNTRWSWGSVNQRGDVILTGWADQCKRINGILAVLVQHRDDISSASGADLSNRHGLHERKTHLDMIGEGRKSYVVMATAADTTAPVRTIKHLDTDLFVGEDLVDVNGDTYLTLKSRIDYRNV